MVVWWCVWRMPGVWVMSLALFISFRGEELVDLGKPDTEIIGGKVMRVSRYFFDPGTTPTGQSGTRRTGEAWRRQG